MSTMMLITSVRIFSFLFFFFSSINAFNITEILNDHPDFSTFNQQLTQTQLATTINSRRTITVLAVDNGALSAISGMSTEEVKKVLSLHVVLDYFDMQKLTSGKSRILTTLFQSSGQANGQQGFLNVTKIQNGVVLGSAVPGSSLNSNLMRSVAAQPYNISVLQVSSVIVPPNLSNSSSPPPSKSPTPAPAPAPSNGTKHAPAPSKSDSPVSEANAPSDSPVSEGNAPSDAPSDVSSPPKPDAPSEADSPASEANAPSDAPSDASTPPKPDGAPTDNAPSSDGPTSDGASDGATTTKSSGIAIADYNSLGFGIGAVMWALIMGAL